MKYTPIENPRHKGCLCCPTPGKKLDKDTWLSVGFGFVTLRFEDSDREGIMFDMDTEEVLSQMEERHSDILQSEPVSILHFNRPLSEDEWEYNKSDGEWYLVKQGMGFA